MSVFRLQNNVPDIYVEKSRDFQLLCRLYDCIIDGVKFDVDSMIDILDTNKCRNNILPLLKEKLGFFSDYQFNDDAIRSILKAFPLMIKNKGSLKSIEQAIEVYKKITNFNGRITVVMNKERQTKYGQLLYDYSLIINIESSLKDTSILDEMLKYLLPAGMMYQIVFIDYIFNQTEPGIYGTYQDDVDIIYVSDYIAGSLRSNSDYLDDHIKAVNTSPNISTVSNFAVFRYNENDDIYEVTNIEVTFNKNLFFESNLYKNTLFIYPSFTLNLIYNESNLNWDYDIEGEIGTKTQSELEEAGITYNIPSGSSLQNNDKIAILPDFIDSNIYIQPPTEQEQNNDE